LNRACFLLALAGLAAPIAIRPQDLPESLTEGALAVKVHALVLPSGVSPSSKAGWQEESIKYTVPGVPVGVKLVGSNVIIMTQVTPFERADGSLTLVAQGQVWLRSASGGLSYRTTIETVSVELGETVFFYPLGIDSAGKAPLRVEISVSRRIPDPSDPVGDAPSREDQEKESQ